MNDSLKKLRESLSLDEVTFTQVRADRLRPNPEGSIHASVSFRFEGDWIDDNKNLVLKGSADVLALPSIDASEDEALAHFVAKVELSYAPFRELEKPANDALLEFTKEYGVGEAWPFLREAIHSLCLRVSFPPLTLPLTLPTMAPIE